MIPTFRGGETGHFFGKDAIVDPTDKEEAKRTMIPLEPNQPPCALSLLPLSLFHSTLSVFRQVIPTASAGTGRNEAEVLSLATGKQN